jgi:hypothetical protein
MSADASEAADQALAAEQHTPPDDAEKGTV